RPTLNGEWRCFAPKDGDYSSGQRQADPVDPCTDTRLALADTESLEQDRSDPDTSQALDHCSHREHHHAQLHAWHSQYLLTTEWCRTLFVIRVVGIGGPLRMG